MMSGKPATALLPGILPMRTLTRMRRASAQSDAWRDHDLNHATPLWAPTDRLNLREWSRLLATIPFNIAVCLLRGGAEWSSGGGVCRWRVLGGSFGTTRVSAGGLDCLQPGSRSDARSCRTRRSPNSDLSCLRHSDCEQSGPPAIPRHPNSIPRTRLNVR